MVGLDVNSKALFRVQNSSKMNIILGVMGGVITKSEYIIQCSILAQNMQKHDQYRLLLLSKQRARSNAMPSRWNKALLWKHNTKVCDINLCICCK